MSKIYLPARRADQWRDFLARPATQWSSGYSAVAVAYCWQEARGFPESVQRVFRNAGREPFLDLRVLLALPEHRVPLPGGSRPSQNDIWVLARSGDELVSITVEGKVSEPFDDPIETWLQGASSGKKKRLKFLCEELGLSGPLPGTIKYQLLHRTASAILEAKRFKARHAVMLVHSFGQQDEGLVDYQDYLALFGLTGLPDQVVSAGERSGIELHFAWVRGETRYLQIQPHVEGEDLEAAYRQMAQEEAREAEALEWADATLEDVADEAR